MVNYAFSGEREIAIMVSRTCNIACRHCGIDSSPQNKERMSLEAAQALVLDAATVPNMRKITFTGGEPLMVPKEMLSLLEMCRNLGLSTRIVTNGFWAKTPKRGRALLKDLRDAGLTEINFSADIFHLEYMEASTLRNALDVAAEAGFARIVSYVCSSNKPPLDEFAKLYGLDRDGLLDLRSVEWDVDFIESIKDEKIFVFYGGLIGLGRVLQYPELLQYVPVDIFPSGKGCREIVDKPVIYPDGSFQACCCAGGKISNFTVGNAFEERLPALYERMAKRSTFRLINTHGPKYLFDRVREAHPEVAMPDTYTSICEMCVRANALIPHEALDAIADEASWRETMRDFAPTPAEDA